MTLHVGHAYALARRKWEDTPAQTFSRAPRRDTGLHCLGGPADGRLRAVELTISVNVGIGHNRSR